MNQAGIQHLINRGGGIAAAILGSPCTVYRTPGNGALQQPGNVATMLNVRFDSKFSFNSSAPNTYGHPVWGALCDRSQLHVGDLLVAPEGSYFVVALQPLLPTAVVSVNATVSLHRPGGGVQQPGSQYYGGDVSSGGSAVATGRPASILQGPKGGADDTGAIGNPRAPWALVLLSAIPGQIIRTGDVMTDDLGRRWSISSAEITDLGWRCNAEFVGT